MNRFTKTTAIALVLGLADLSCAHAAQLNTTPLTISASRCPRRR